MINDDCNIIAREDLMYEGDVVFAIGHDNKSCTSTPKFYLYDNIYFVDCPGTQDQDQMKEYPNQTAVHLIQKKAEACLILLVISPNQLTVNRGATFV